MTLRASWSKTPYVKKLDLVVAGNKVEKGAIETISDPRVEKVSQSTV